MNSNDRELSTSTERRERGAQSYREGHSFEERVAELYRLLHYEVEHGRIFSGRQVDLFITTTFGDMKIQRAIECKAGPVVADHIDSFVAKLRLVRSEYPAAQGTIVSGASFTDAVTAHAAREGIQLTLYRDLAARLFDGHAYAQNLLRECQSNTRYRIPLYIEPSIGYDTVGQGINAFEVVDEWLQDSDWNQLTLLGDVGTGKSFLSRMIAYRLAEDFLKRPLERPLPILIDLRNADREFSLEGLVLTHLAKNGLSSVSFDVFMYVLSQGNIVLILDGFDEMAARVTRQVTNRNFHELARAAQERAKVLLTCRTHYFKSRTEEEEVVLGSRHNYGSETARDLYWELIARAGFRIAYLRPFGLTQIEEYVRRAKPGSADRALAKIRNTYNLIELSQRPMLLEMIVKSLDALTGKEINAATLYEVFTDAWVHRDQWRDVLPPEAKLTFVKALAHSLWNEDATNIHHEQLFAYLKQELAAQIQDPQHLAEVDSEIRTASFLTRDDSGHYGFAHKSYAEFFFARYLAGEMKADRFDCLHTRRLSPEVISFLKYMVNTQEVERTLEDILLGEYRPLVSENALVCLYGLRRHRLLTEQEEHEDEQGSALKVPLPPKMRLAEAQLEQVSLEGAVMVGVDLSRANLSEAVCPRADFTDSDLSYAKLEKADLSHTSLQGANLSFTLSINVNFDRADLSGANFRGANLADSYLLHASFGGADFSEATAANAILPEELLWLAGHGLNVEQIRQDVQSCTPSITEQYWSMIEDYYPSMLRIAQIMRMGYAMEPQDIVSEITIQLAAPQSIERLMKLNEDERRRFIYQSMRKTVQQLIRRSEGLFGDIPISEIPSRQLNNLFETNERDEGVIADEFAAQRTEEVTDDEEDEEIDDLAHEEESDEFQYLEEETTRFASIDEYVENLAGRTVDPLERIIIAEVTAGMRNMLSEQLWKTVEARYIDEYGIEEIAAQQGVPKQAIQKQLAKAREILRRHFFTANEKVKEKKSRL